MPYEIWWGKDLDTIYIYMRSISLIMFTIVSCLPLSPITYFPNQSLIPKGKVSNPEFCSVLPNLIIHALFSVDVQVLPPPPTVWNIHSIMNGWLIL